MLITNIKCTLICVSVVLCACHDGPRCFVYTVFFKIHFVLNLICYSLPAGYPVTGHGFPPKVTRAADSVRSFLRFTIFAGLIFGREVVTRIFCMEKRFLNLLR